MILKKWVLALTLPALALTACETAGLSDEEVVAGLKEALRIGSENSVSTAHAADGYFLNPRIKIPFPQDAAIIQSTLNGLGLGSICDNLVLKLNRAAEDAADEALPIFTDAIQNMTIEDGMAILMGNDNAATEYLKTNTYESLRGLFQPDIEASLNSVGATTAWTSVVNQYNSIPLVQPANADLPDYTTRKALDGLFVLITDEELKIRTDVNARVTDLLKEVFAEQDN